MGRHSTYTEKIGTAICERMASGESLRAICRDKDMPAIGTVIKWAHQNEKFAKQYACAREALVDVLAAETVDIADGATPESVAVARLRFDARRWFAGKVSPKKYGDKITQELTGPNDGPIQMQTSAAHDKLGTLVSRAADDPE